MDSFDRYRREYGALTLIEDNLLSCPFEQFKQWFKEITALESADDPTVMTLSTVDHLSRPDSRIVLLKGLKKNSFIFYTNYNSNKSKQLDANPWAAINFYWSALFRQVRIRGFVEKITFEESQAYFATRPLGSQISAIVSPQSQTIENRTVIEQACQKLKDKQVLLSCPKHWGGHRLKPIEYEFWQGRDNRLHDRILYYKKAGQWKYKRLAP